MMRNLNFRRSANVAVCQFGRPRCAVACASSAGLVSVSTRTAATDAAPKSSPGFILSDEDKAALGIVTTKRGHLAFQRPARGGWSKGNENAFLHVVRPDLSKEFDEEANPGVSWKSLTMGSKYLATWKCSVCANHYQHEVKDRAKGYHVVTPCTNCRKNLQEQAEVGGAEKKKRAEDLKRVQDLKEGKPRSSLGRKTADTKKKSQKPPEPTGPPEWKELEAKISCWDLLELSQGLVQAARGILIAEFKTMKERIRAEKKKEDELKKAASTPPKAEEADDDDEDDPIEKPSNEPATVDNPAALAAADPTEEIETYSRKEATRLMVLAHEIKKLNNLENLLARPSGGQNFAQPDASMAAFGEEQQPLTADSLFTEQEQAAITQEFKFQRSLFEMALESAGGDLRSKNYKASAEALNAAYGAKIEPPTKKAMPPKKTLLTKPQEQRLVSIYKLWAAAAEMKPDDGIPDDKPLRIRCRVVLLHLATLGKGERCVLEKIITSRLVDTYEAVKTREELMANVAHFCIDGTDADAMLSQAGHTWLYSSNLMAFDVVVHTKRRDLRRKQSGTSPNPEIQYEPNQGYYYYFDPDHQQYYYSYNGIDYTDEAGNAAPYRDWSIGQQKKIIVATTEEMEKKLKAHEEEKAAKFAAQEAQFKEQQERFAAQQAEYAAQYQGQDAGAAAGWDQSQQQYPAQ